MAYLGQLDPRLNVFKLTKGGNLQTQLDTKYNDKLLKGKTIYDITKSMLMSIGTPLDIQTQILKDVGAKGGGCCHIESREILFSGQIFGHRSNSIGTESCFS